MGTGWQRGPVARGTHVVVGVALAGLLGCTAPVEMPTVPGPTATPASTPAPSAAARGTAAPPDATLHVARHIDGDSFVATDGVEYRVGLIDTPELGTCGADAAATRAQDLLDGGFTAQPYATDRHGRTVARILTDQGDLGVILAAEGLAGDRYLADLRGEHPAYAAELDDAFEAAQAAERGLWGTCFSAQEDSGGQPAGAAAADTPRSAPSPVAHSGRTGAWPCHPAYVECLPDGPDLDCAEIGHRVALVGAADPFRLDGNSTTRTDGTGCDTYGPWAADVAYPYDR